MHACNFPEHTPPPIRTLHSILSVHHYVIRSFNTSLFTPYYFSLSFPFALLHAVSGFPYLSQLDTHYPLPMSFRGKIKLHVLPHSSTSSVSCFPCFLCLSINLAPALQRGPLWTVPQSSRSCLRDSLAHSALPREEEKRAGENRRERKGGKGKG